MGNHFFDLNTTSVQRQKRERHDAERTCQLQLSNTLYGVMVLWFYGCLVLWFYMFMVYGFIVLWFYDFVVLWFYGFLVSKKPNAHSMFSGID